MPRTSFGSRTTRRLRRSGQIPGVVYSGGEDATAFQVTDSDARVLLLGGHALFDLEIEGSKPIPVVIKEQQHHPVRGDLAHLDLQAVSLDVAIEAEVVIELEGIDDAPGVKEGGVLEHVTREVTVEALPTEIPDQITVDVSAMEMHETLALSAIEAPEGTRFVAEDLDEVTLVTLSPPRVEAEPEPELEEEAELVGEGEEGEAEEGQAEEGDSESSSDEE